MEAKPRQGEHTVQEAAELLGVPKPWLFKFLRHAGHLNGQRFPIGIAAAKRYITIASGSHMRPGLGQCTHYRPMVTADGMQWLTQQVAEAQLQERLEQEKKVG